jgi:hypothetical protein
MNGSISLPQGQVDNSTQYAHAVTAWDVDCQEK